MQALVAKGDDTARVILGHGKQVLEHALQPLSQLRLKAVEDEVGVCLRDSAAILDIVPHNCIHHREVAGWAIGKVGDDQTIRLSAVLLDYDDVCEVVAAADIDQLAHLCAATIYPL